MKTKEIEIGGKKFNIKELLYIDVVELSSITDRKTNALKLFELSGIPEEVSKTLCREEGLFIMNEINNLNGFEDFQKTSGADKKN